MSIDNNIRRAFNKAAPSYDEHSPLQQQSGLHLIKLIRNASINTQAILDLGCGTGSTSAQLAQAFNAPILHACDMADELLVLARQRAALQHAHIYPLNFNHTFNLDQYFTLIFANMSLHWSTNIKMTIAYIHQQLSTQGTLACSLPLAGTLAELQPDYGVNDFLDSTHVVNLFEQAGFDVYAQCEATVTLLFPDSKSALASLKRVGANQCTQRPSRGLAGKARLMQREIKQLTYRIGYFLARKMRKIE